jgi:release factor glutamine methyltransferase
MIRSATSVADTLREGTLRLREAGIESPGLDAEILLREALGATRVQLFDMLPYPIRPRAASQYRALIARRVEGVPIAYITGRREFYGHEFTVTEDVLVPRPETEYLVEFALEWLKNHAGQSKSIVDVGTGSGAIAVSVWLETNGHHRVIASDVSPAALDVARENNEKLGAAVEFVEGSLLEWLDEPVDLILANLPYLRPDQAHDGIAYEPSVALFSGDDGFELNRKLLEQAPSLLKTPGSLIMELDPDQAELALEAGRQAFPDALVEIKQDLARISRYLIIER